MSITQTIEIDGKQVPFRASAAIPRIYRIKFHRDIYKDLRTLEKSVGEGDEESSNLDIFSLEMFENIAYIMAKHADANIPDTPEEWLDQFNTFSIYQVLPKLIELWGLNVQTQVAAVANVVSQYNTALTYGEENPEEVLPEFLAELEAAGINDIIADYQAQLDAWLAENGK